MEKDQRKLNREKIIYDINKVSFNMKQMFWEVKDHVG